MKPSTLTSQRWASRSSSLKAAVTNETLTIAFLISIAVHISAILVGAVVVHENNSRPTEFLSVSLIDTPRQQVSPSPPEIDVPPKFKKPPPPSKLDKPKEPAAKASVATPDPMQALLPSAPAKEAAKKTETSPSFASIPRIEGGGSEAGTGNLFDKGAIGVLPGPGTAGGGGGTVASGLGRGSGAPGLPAQTVLRSNREAKPVQTVRANYPPMALRAGLESDVTLKIEVDAQGNVTKAEITKSGGSGFDDEALKAVKQSRFEPAHRDGQNVAAEFTYVYRFRVKR